MKNIASTIVQFLCTVCLVFECARILFQSLFLPNVHKCISVCRQLIGGWCVADKRIANRARPIYLYRVPVLVFEQFSPSAQIDTALFYRHLSRLGQHVSVGRKIFVAVF